MPAKQRTTETRSAVTIENYHAHIYYDDANRHIAEALREEIEQRFVMRMGRWRENPVGPHPQAMFQVAFENDVFARIVPWFLINRRGLDILIHPNTGSSLGDHTDHAIWLGNKLRLRLDELDNAS